MIHDRWAMCGWRSPLLMAEAWQSLCRSSRVGQHLSIANVVTPATRLVLPQQCKGLEMLWLRPSRSALLSTHFAHSHLYPRLSPCYFTLRSLRMQAQKWLHLHHRVRESGAYWMDILSSLNMPGYLLRQILLFLTRS